MRLEQRVDLLSRLGHNLLGKDEYLDALIHQVAFKNHWFTGDNVRKAIRAIAQNYLQSDKLESWVQNYSIPERNNPLSVGLVPAGNTPLDGFHDLISIFVSGNRSLIRLSDKDEHLLPYLIKVILEIDPEATSYFSLADKLKGMDAVIAEIGNHPPQVFKTYFGKYPHILRSRRNSVAILSGEEKESDLLALGEDVFSFFGLGTHNVSKVYVPEDYDFDKLLEMLHEYREIIRHKKYKHNFDYNLAMHILNNMPYRSNGCVILSENTNLQSRIASLHYEYYTDLPALKEELTRRKGEIQCIAGNIPISGLDVIPFGKTSTPPLNNYPEGVDTLDFLNKL